jgi:hypothetical protein
VEDVSPKETRQRRAKCAAECTIVDAEGHTVHCCPKCPVRNGNPVVVMDLLPRLDNTGEKDGSTDIRACKLDMHLTC